MGKESKTIDCSKTCRMTSTLRDSEYCSKKAELVDDKLVFGCQTALSMEPKSIRYLYECDYWAMNMKDSCKTCPLECVENKNAGLSELKKQAEKINRISETLGPGMGMAGISGNDIQNISDIYSKEKADPIVKQALDIADFTSFIFNSAMNGKMIDPVFMQEYARHAIKNMEILEKKREIREKLSKEREQERVDQYNKSKK